MVLKYLKTFAEIFIFCAIAVQLTHAQENASCSSYKSYLFFNDTHNLHLPDIPIVWPTVPYFTEYVVSDPLCLDGHNQLIREHCRVNWTYKEVSNTTCVNYQEPYSYTKVCPPHFHSIGTGRSQVCIRLSDPDIWSPFCLKSGSSIWFGNASPSQKRIIRETLSHMGEHLKKVWMPVKKSSFFNRAELILPGERWREDVIPNEMSNLNLTAEYCTYLEVVDGRIMQTDGNCSLILPSLCMYNESSTISLSCPNGLYTTRYSDHQDKCYGVRRFNTQSIHDSDNGYDENNLEMSQSDKEDYSHFPVINTAAMNLIYEDIFGKKEIYRSYGSCWMGLQKIGKDFIWLKTNEKVSFVNWNSETNFSLTYAGFDADGSWRLYGSKREFNCVLYQELYQGNNSTRTYLFSLVSNIRILKLYMFDLDLWKIDNEDFGFKCFKSNGSDLIPIKNIELSSKIGTSFKFNVYEYFQPSYIYWCEGHSIQNFSLIESNKFNATANIIYKRFALLLKLDIGQCGQCWDNDSAINEFVHDILEDLDISRVDLMSPIDQEVDILIHVQNFSLPDFNHLLGFEVINSLEKIKKNATDACEKFNLCSVLSVKNTQYCLEHYVDNSIWPKIAKIGETVYPFKKCLNKYGLPKFRKCVGDEYYGAMWENDMEPCDENQSSLNVSQILYNLVNGDAAGSEINFKELSQVINIENVKTFNAADIHHTAELLKTTVNSINVTDAQTKRDQTQHLLDIVSHISLCSEESIADSNAQLNSSNVILDAFETWLTKISLMDMSTNDNEDGIFSLEDPRLQVQISDPGIKEVTGLALISQPSNSSDKELNDFKIIPLTIHNSIEDVALVEDLEVATWIPKELYNSIIKSNAASLHPSFKVLVTVFQNDMLFPEKVPSGSVDGRVISISVPGYTSQLPGEIPIIFKSRDNNSGVHCSFWNFEAFGSWSNIGCKHAGTFKGRDSILNLCMCTHLTHFAQLIFSDSERNISQNYTILSAITLAGSVLSAIGILGIFLTAALFKSWRVKLSTKFLLNLTTAISFQVAIMVALNIQEFSKSSENSSALMSDAQCIVVGVLLHYSVLAVFSWMFIIGVLQYRRYVIVFERNRPPHLVLKSMICAWGLSLLPVLIMLLINPNLYIPQNSGNNRFCYPTGSGLNFGVLLPVFTIFAANFLMLILVVKNIYYNKDKSIRTEQDSTLLLSQIRVTILLVYLLGITWGFGFASWLLNNNFILNCCFCTFSTIQGVSLFINFIICDPTVRTLYKTYCIK